jgi:hypothetical protein
MLSLQQSSKCNSDWCGPTIIGSWQLYALTNGHDTVNKSFRVAGKLWLGSSPVNVGSSTLSRPAPGRRVMRAYQTSGHPPIAGQHAFVVI